MGLDVNTLFLVTIYVEAMLGLLLLFAWIQNSGIHAVAWWGCAHLLRAASVVLFGMYGTVSDAISIDLANAVLFTAFAVTWTGARVFDGRAPEPMYLVGGAVAVAARLPHASSFVDSLDAKVLLASGIITAYTWATAYEFWRGRSEPLVSRWPAIFMLFAHGALFLLRTPLVAGAAVVADQSGVRQRLAHGAELRGAAVHHRDRLHPAGDGEGAHRAAPQDRGAGRSADRHRQPPRLPRRGHGAQPSASRRNAGRSRCCWPTSTTSSRSTTASAMPSATACCRFSPRPRAPSSAPPT